MNFLSISQCVTSLCRLTVTSFYAYCLPSVQTVASFSVGEGGQTDDEHPETSKVISNLFEDISSPVYRICPSTVHV